MEICICIAPYCLQNDCIYFCCKFFSKPAQLEGLEVDQYMWGILNTLSSSDVEEVTIDSAANWKPARSPMNIKSEDDTSDSCSANKRLNKAMSPGSMTLPTMNNWDMSQSMSPYIPPDMNSEFIYLSPWLFNNCEACCLLYTWTWWFQFNVLRRHWFLLQLSFQISGRFKSILFLN